MRGMGDGVSKIAYSDPYKKASKGTRIAHDPRSSSGDF